MCDFDKTGVHFGFNNEKLPEDTFIFVISNPQEFTTRPYSDHKTIMK